jgi:hypothetical protein
MLSINHQKFLELDQLSQQKVPFFFDRFFDGKRFNF